MADKVFLGTSKEHGRLYLEKHSWDCGWYWGFGYIGNKNLHTHFDSAFLQKIQTYSESFNDNKFTDSQWWDVLELFKRAYTLREAANMFSRGSAGITNYSVSVKDTEMAERLNNQLKAVLDSIWFYVTHVGENHG